MFEKELHVGKEAVRIASRLIRRVQNELTSSHALSKSDRSPVTVADYLSQAIVCRIIHQHFPAVPIVAEEDSSALEKGENAGILAKILEFANRERVIQGLVEENNLFECIDLGTQEPADIFWTLDPIDGTKGFLRGEQFAVALALIEDGEVKLGVLGCPRLTLHDGPSGEGHLFSAVCGVCFRYGKQPRAVYFCITNLGSGRNEVCPELCVGPWKFGPAESDRKYIGNKTSGGSTGQPGEIRPGVIGGC